ncbi:unnamed protein product [Lactuca virosa]|uniref:FRIGIDA-like protein n=1 Tax=Lactuca virosa TaxID=75947 RepID=A0AAU9MBC3_9ASTR|nr:unnamed protein product [Lactuca virosa]
MALEQRCSNVEAKLDDTLQKNKALSIRVESLEKELLDKEKLLLDRKVEVSQVGSDEDCLVKEGVVRIVDKVIEFPEFLQIFGQIKHICFAAGEESGREALRKEVVVGMFDALTASSTSSHIWRDGGCH